MFFSMKNDPLLPPPQGSSKNNFSENCAFVVYYFAVLLLLTFRKIAYFIPQDKWEVWEKSIFDEPWGGVGGIARKPRLPLLNRCHRFGWYFHSR
jgi:hypothetical protein